jgi:hypothetical protein
MNSEIRDAMDALAGRPSTIGFADNALHRANRVRRRRVALSAGALALAALVAVPLATRAGDRPAYAATPLFGLAAGSDAAVDPNAAPDPGCVSLPVEPTGGDTSHFVKEVQPADWPDFVRIAVAALPARGDYVMQSGYSWCHGPAGVSNAYAVVNLGHGREHGHLTLDVFGHYDPEVVGARCDEMSELANRGHQPGAPQWHLDFCDDATGTAPMAFGASLDGERVAGAVYPDGRAVIMADLADGPGDFALTAAEMRPAVTSPELIAGLPAE